MLRNYEALVSLGYRGPTPDLICSIWRGQVELWVCDDEDGGEISRSENLLSGGAWLLSRAEEQAAEKGSADLEPARTSLGSLEPAWQPGPGPHRGHLWPCPGGGGTQDCPGHEQSLEESEAAAGTMGDSGNARIPASEASGGTLAEEPGQGQHRGPSWRADEVADLLAIWGQKDTLQQFRVGHRNEHIFRAIAAQMVKRGHQKTWQQCRTKAKALRRQFTAVRDANQQPGAGRTTMPHYKELARILGPTATELLHYSFATGGGVEAGTNSTETQMESLVAGPSLGHDGLLPSSRVRSNSSEGKTLQPRATPERSPERGVPCLLQDSSRSKEKQPDVSPRSVESTPQRRWHQDLPPPEACSTCPQQPMAQDPSSPSQAGCLLPRPESPSARGEATALHPRATRQVSQMPGAIRMRRLRWERRTQRESWQQEALRVERLRRQEAQDFHSQVLQELCRFRRDHAVAIEEVKAGRTALERLVTQVESERRLVLECLEEMRQLRVSTVVAAAQEQGH